MSKYRVVEEGKFFKVQKSYLFFFWGTLTLKDFGDPCYFNGQKIALFNNPTEALQALCKKLSTSLLESEEQ